MDTVTSKNIGSYFNLGKSECNNFSFENYRDIIYNMEGTGMILEPRPL